LDIVDAPGESPDGVVDDVACTLCGCVCDDLRMTVQGGRIVAADRACRLAERCFLEQDTVTRPAALIGGKPVTLDAAIAESADTLRRAKAPLIYGLSTSSTAGQRAAVELADRLGAVIDTTASTCHAPSIMALQSVGESTCTLGEIRNRADLVVFWGSNPVESHPRHLERYSAEPAGLFVPRGRQDRRLVVVDVQRTETAESADRFVHVEPGADFDLIWALRGALRGLTPPESVGGVTRDDVESLAAEMQACRYGVVFFGLGLAHGTVPHANVEALLRLVTDLNGFTRFTVRRMRNYGDVAGADSVLCWRTGYPFSVNLNRGYPRYNPGEYTADAVLARHEADACLFVGADGIEKLSPAARRGLERIPTILLDHDHHEPPIAPHVLIATSAYGVHLPGTAYRMDEVPIPLRAFLPRTHPADHEVLAQVLQRIWPASGK